MLIENQPIILVGQPILGSAIGHARERENTTVSLAVRIVKNVAVAAAD